MTRRFFLLGALCVGVNLLEASVSLGLGIKSGDAIAPQAGAVAPLGLFSDLRWLVVYERSWPTFAFGVIVVLVLRSLLSAAQASLAYPLEPPSYRRFVARAAVFNLLTGILLAPFALLLFALGAFSLSWLYLAAVPSVMVIATLLHAGGLSSRWWRELPAVGGVGWMLLSMVVVTLAAGVVSVNPIALVIPVAVGTGIFEAVAWKGVLRSVVCRPPRRFVPAVPVLLVVFLLGAVLAASEGFRVARVQAATPTSELRYGALLHHQVVLLVYGYASRWAGGPVAMPGAPAGAAVIPFSYRGMRANGTPLSYTPADTRASLGHLARLMSRQVGLLEEKSHEAIDIVAVSEGSAVATRFVELKGHPPVKKLILVSPLVAPGAVRYPATGRQGWGFVAGYGLKLISDWLRPISGLDLAPEQPFFRSLLNERHRHLCARPSCGAVSELEVAPLADALCGPVESTTKVPAVVVSAFHGADFSDRSVRRAIALVLSDRSVRADRTTLQLDHLIASFAAAWRVPSLPAGF